MSSGTNGSEINGHDLDGHAFGHESPAEGMLSVIREMREVKGKLAPQPSLEAVLEAEKAISEVEHDLISKLSEIVSSRRPYGVDPGWFTALQAMKEDRLRRDAEIAKMKHAAVLELNNFHRHYESIIAQAESSILEDTEGPVGLQGNLKVGAGPRIIHYPVYTQIGEVTSKIGGSNSGVAKASPAVGTKEKELRGLSLALKEKHEDREDIPPKLLAMIEDANYDKRQAFCISNMFENSLTAVPSSLCSLVLLTRLDLSKQQLKSLPNAIGNLINLKILDVFGNQLTELPEGIGNLKKLMSLDFHSNRVEELPGSIGNCTELVEIIGDFNKLKSLPEKIGQCISLQKLSFSLNQLTYVPFLIGLLVDLLELDLHHNQIEFVPEQIGQLSKLKKLNLASQNASLTSIPAEIGQLSSLEVLNIGGCQITYLPDSIVDLKNLKILILDGNPLKDPPFEVAEKGLEAVMEFIENRPSRSKKPKEADGNGGNKIFKNMWIGGGGKKAPPKEDQFSANLLSSSLPPLPLPSSHSGSTSFWSSLVSPGRGFVSPGQGFVKSGHTSGNSSPSRD